LLSYLNLRARFGDKFLANHEHTLLSHHLKRNLWLDSDVDMMLLHDDILVHLDIAMAVRRDGVSGAATPDGILTRFEATPFGRIIESIEDEPSPAAVDLGLMLLELGEDTVDALNKYVDQVLALTAADGRLHDASIGISTASTGLTIHCSALPNQEVEARLRAHCERRKYLQKANSWFGLALGPDGSVRLVAELVGPWQFDAARETAWGNAPAMRPMNSVVGKVGRNDPCPCGSGRKFKRCCGKA